MPVDSRSYNGVCYPIVASTCYACWRRYGCAADRCKVVELPRIHSTTLRCANKVAEVCISAAIFRWYALTATSLHPWLDGEFEIVEVR